MSEEHVGDRARVLRLIVSATIGVVMLGFALSTVVASGGIGGAPWLLGLMLTLIAVAQSAAAIWGFSVWRRERGIRLTHTGSLVQSCLVTADTRDELRRCVTPGSRNRLSYCVVADDSGVALMTSARTGNTARVIPWSSIGGVELGTREGSTAIPNAISLAPTRSSGSRISLIPIGRGFFGLNPVAPQQLRELCVRLGELHART